MGRVSKKAEKIREIGVGLLGYAFMGKAHANGYRKMPFFFYPPPALPRLVAICGRTEEAVAEAAKRFGFETYYTDWKKLIADDRIELVDNCLPNNMHAEPCIEAAEAGKNIICEKPLASTLEDAKAVYEAAEKAGVKNMTAFNYRFVPAIRLAKQLIDEGYIGKILQYRAVYLQEWIMDPNFPLVWRLRKSVAGSGALGDLGAHIIDLARFLVGEVTSVCGLTETFIKERPLPEDPEKKGKVDVDDVFIAMARFKNGAIGSFEASRFCAGRKNYQRVEIHGTEGSIVFNLERLNELEVYSKKDPEDRMGFRDILVTESVHPFMEHWWPHGHIIGWEHTFVHEIHHFIDCIVNDKPVAPMAATFYDGLKCQEILNAIEESARKGRWVELP
ncbi:gfo/Idh/MocA family oxidoreductase [Candidatus Bathyarchaeota archaeon]|nr:MAG: gfo/Idh/MocA family oxidoreductase [Candidatus Bathyarchaeota archaeon]RLI06243.1 MAG: gfo/Idh/MocA family oxidoreductase [Candidatus Bathyarchaeota archaeon]